MQETKTNWTAWPHQNEAIDRLRQAVKDGERRIVVTIPTGGGKTGVAAEVSRRFTEKGHRGLFIVHRQELVYQADDTMTRMGIKTTKITAGTRIPVGAMPMCICTVQTLANRLADMDKYGQRPKEQISYVWWDECHHIAATTWKRVSDILRKWYPEMVEIGLTATPRRPDGKGLDNVFNMLIETSDVRALIESNHLSDYRLVRPKKSFLSLLTENLEKDGRGDFKQKSQSAAIEGKQERIAGETVSLYEKYGQGQQAIFFGIDIPHSKRTAARFNSAGIKAVHVDGTTDTYLRRRLIHNFRRGETQVLCNVGIVNEGFDVPEASCVILGRKTRSIVFYLQAIGRVLRYREGKIATIIDQAGSYEFLGMPDAARVWDLSGNSGKKKQEKKQEKKERECKKCGMMSKERRCPYCGEEMVEVTEVLEMESEFVAVGRGGQEAPAAEKPPTFRRAFSSWDVAKLYRDHEEKGANLLEGLKHLAEAVGYKPEWAYIRYEQYKRKKAAEEREWGHDATKSFVTLNEE